MAAPGTLCPITLEPIVDPVASPCCGNLFSRAGLDEALRHSPLCPLCRTDIRHRPSAIPTPAMASALVINVRFSRVGDYLANVKNATTQTLPDYVVEGLPEEKAGAAIRRSLRGLTDWPLVGLVGSAKIHLDVISTGAVKAILAEQRVSYVYVFRYAFSVET